MANVAIVGAGGMGLAAAFHARKAGHRQPFTKLSVQEIRVG